MKLNETQKLLIKSFIGGMITIKGIGFSSGEITSTPAWLVVRDFINHFSIVFLFWLIIPEKYRETKWIWAGVLGSFIFSSRFIIIAILYYSLTTPQLTFLNSWSMVLFSGLSTIPQWLVLRKKYKWASTWLIANILAFGFLISFSEFELIKYFTFETKNIIINDWINIVFKSFIYYLLNGIFGLILGISLNSFFSQVKTEKENHGNQT